MFLQFGVLRFRIFVFVGLFLPFSPSSGRPKQLLGNPENQEKRRLPQISSALLKPPSLKGPFAALQVTIHHAQVGKYNS